MQKEDMSEDLPVENEKSYLVEDVQRLLKKTSSSHNPSPKTNLKSAQPNEPYQPSPQVDDKTLKQKRKEFETIVQQYLESNPILKKDRKSSELEIRFGTNTRLSRPITKIDYDNVVKQFMGCGFKPEIPDGLQILRIQNEYTDPRTGAVRMSNIRAEITGTDLIKEYCRTNSLQSVINMPSTLFNKLKFTQKMTATAANGTVIKRLDMDDFNFRVSYQTEQDFNVQSTIARNIINKWIDSKKMFRCMNRVRLSHPDYPVFADVSIVKMGKKTNKVVIPQYTIQEAGVFDNVEQYEIELEIDNTRVGSGTPFSTVGKLMAALRKCIRIVLCGLQGTKFPISYPEKDTIIQSYMRLLHGEYYNQPRRVYPKDFIGPASYTLQMENIIPVNDQSTSPNIRTDYTVTDKADGDRMLLYIAEDGRIFMIDTNMNVRFTGVKTVEKTIFESLIDGEHIKYDKHGNFINLYAAFDVYYIFKKSVREQPFLTQTMMVQKGNREEPEEEIVRGRLELLHQLIELIKPISILEPMDKEVAPKEPTHSSEFIIKCKAFEQDTETRTIFDGCSRIMAKVADGVFEYNTDGLIFTPSKLPVGGNIVGGPPGPLYKSTWEHSFKWKPAEFNTIDFLVSIKKDKTGKDEVHHIFQEGRNLQNVQDVIQYKTLVLRCGFDERKHGYLNPCQDILDDNLPSPDDLDDEDTYKPVPFQPTNPFDPNACYTNILLKDDGSRLFMMTEEGEYFEENTIVECKYVMTNADGWKWVPLRVRYDKTAELRAGLKNYGNAYHVANNNWHSIHHPITTDMITSGEGIPEFAVSEDVYYNRANTETTTRSLRDFHNLYVKQKLLVGVSARGSTLIDYAVGKAGDLSKWIRGRLSFVFGIDISKDNIYNQLDGACARFLTARKKYADMPRALFVKGNSGLTIRDGKAFSTEKDKQVAKAVFGEGAKDATLLGKGVYRHYGVAESGFNISSCQFAMHYFFENKVSLHGFLSNLAECTKVNGYFVGTCYDGKTVFDLLKGKQKGDSITIFKNDQKIYEITKMYDQTGFPDDDMSIGYPINVYQESINLVFQEFLVNFNYFIQLMEDYGFVLISREDAQHMDLPNATGLFSELFTHMENEVKRNPRKKADYGKSLFMTPEEKRISFMNRYFVFKKVRNVDTKKISQIILEQHRLVSEAGEEQVAELEATVTDFEKANEAAFVATATPVIIPRKLKKPKLVLKPFAPTVLTPSPVLPDVSRVPNLETMVIQPEPVEIMALPRPVEVTQLQPTGQPIRIKVKRPPQP